MCKLRKTKEHEYSSITDEKLDKMLQDLEADENYKDKTNILILSAGDELYIKKLNLKIRVTKE